MEASLFKGLESLKDLEIKNLTPAETTSESKNLTISKPIFHKAKKTLPGGGAYGTGRRKSSVARVWVKPGKGMVTVNKKDISAYFCRDSYRTQILQPFVSTKTVGMYDVVCTTKGGGTTGQAGAIVHGVARALDCLYPDFHTALRKGGFLTRDSRKVERKKYGKRKARKSTQFSKR